MKVRSLLESIMKILGNGKQTIAVIVVLLLVVGMGEGVYLVQRQQIIKSKASAGSFVNAFEIKDKNGNTIQCDSSTNPPTCTTKTLDISVRVKDLNPLLP